MINLYIYYYKYMFGMIFVLFTFYRIDLSIEKMMHLTSSLFHSFYMYIFSVALLIGVCEHTIYRSFIFPSLQNSPKGLQNFKSESVLFCKQQDFTSLALFHEMNFSHLMQILIFYFHSPNVFV